MEINKDIALSIALDRILKLEDELIYNKTLVQQLTQQVKELQVQLQNKEQ